MSDWTVNRRVDRFAAGLLLGVSGLTLGMAVLPLAATPALAACDVTAPAPNQTITCDTSDPNPETDGIVITALPSGST
jgi:hypothetical protein